MQHLDFYPKLGLREEDWPHCIPLSWHVDGVKVYRSQKAWVYSFGCCTRKGPSIDTKLLFLLFREQEMLKPDTHDEIGAIIAYVMRVLMTGMFPDVQWDGAPWPEKSLEFKRAGQPFAGGWRACFAAFKADLEARAMVHKMVRNWSCNSICEHCLASKLPELSYGDFSDGASYMQFMLTHDEFLELNPPHRQSSWINVPGWTKDRNLDVPYMQGWLYLLCVVLCFSSVVLFLETCTRMLHAQTACPGYAACGTSGHWPFVDRILAFGPLRGATRAQTHIEAARGIVAK